MGEIQLQYTCGREKRKVNNILWKLFVKFSPRKWKCVPSVNHIMKLHQNAKCLAIKYYLIGYILFNFSFGTFIRTWAYIFPHNIKYSDLYTSIFYMMMYSPFILSIKCFTAQKSLSLLIDHLIGYEIDI